MISEVINALFATYLYSEYLLKSQNDFPSSSSSSRPSRVSRSSTAAPPTLSGGAQAMAVLTELIPQRSVLIGGILVAIVNVLDRVTGSIHVVTELVESALHIPKAIIAALAYIAALYVDVQRKSSLTVPSFLRKVGWAFLRVLPAYPFLAVLISFVFLFVINLWEALHLPMEWLNAPIYYGTLYGPFAWVYVTVKTQILQEQTSLPV